MAKIKHTRNENGQNFTHQNKTSLFWRKKAKIKFPIYGSTQISTNLIFNFIYLRTYENICFISQQLNVDQLRDMIYKEVMEYHQPKTFNAFLRPAPKEPPATKTTLEPEQIKLDMKPDTNTVKVNVDKLVPRSSADVEMLSAKVENVQKESIQKTEPEKVKETMKSETKPQENKTVSSNTKELIKAALLNSNLRKQRQGIMFSIIYSCDYIW